MNTVLIIGDSISLGYTPVVEELLAGRAEVSHNPGNACFSAFGLRNLRDWLGATRWDLIHCNFGIWDLHYLEPTADPLVDSVGFFNRNGVRRTTAAQYAANLEAILAILRETGARLVWATITPLPVSEKITTHGGEELEYNAVARDIMRAHGVRVNDLHAHALPVMGRIQPPDDVHFTDEGYRYLGEKVAAVIAEELAL